MITMGYDIGGTHSRVALFDEQWHVLYRDKQRLRDDTSPQAVVSLMTEMCSQALSSSEVSADQIAAIGVGLAGQLDLDGRHVINAPNLGWRDEPFVSHLQSSLDSVFGDLPPIRLVNDLSAQVWAEYTAGAVRGERDVLAIYIGTGVGGAVLIDGTLYTGAGGQAGEIGHVKVFPGGRLCGCGERGCLEAYAGGVHIEEQVRRIALRRESTLDVWADDEKTEIDLGRADALSRDDHELGALWEEISIYVAMAAANACTLLNPGVLLLGGGVWEHCEALREHVITRLTPLILEVARRDLRMCHPTVGDAAGALGSASLAACKAGLDVPLLAPDEPSLECDVDDDQESEPIEDRG